MMYRYVLPAMLLIAGSAALSADTRGYAERRAAEAQAGIDKALAGLVPGKPQTCLYQDRGGYQTQRFGDTILYMRNRTEIYRVETGGGCFGLDRGDAIITRTTINALCRGDIVRTVDLSAHTPSGSCSFGDFVPYTKPHR